MTAAINKKRVYIDNFYIFIGAITILKLTLGGCFSSDYQNELFIPFVSWFAEHGKNPYQYFYEAGYTDLFPYPAVMLLIESAGAVIVKIFGITSLFMTNIAYKLPSLALDFMGLYFLVKIFPEKRWYAAIFYFASPIILYASYMHGQLDLIPTVLLLGSNYYISSKEKHREWKAAVFLILALTAKLHILSAVPVILMYLYKREGLKKAAAFGISVFGGTILGWLVFFSEGFKVMVLWNKEQNVITQVILKYADTEIYIPIVAVLMVYLITFSVAAMNRDLFLSLCGIVFAVFLVFCPPMPGWYIWIVPYMTVFFGKVDLSKYKNIVLYTILNIIYLFYFLFMHNRNRVDLYFFKEDLSVLKIDNRLLSNITFTLLAGILIYITFSIYQLGIASNSLYKRRNLPFTIGVAGDSGTGKSTLIAAIEKCLGKSGLLSMEGDGDHRWERGEEHWNEFSHLNPKANYLYRQADDLRQLRTGNSIKRVEYNHDTGRFTKAKKMKPKAYIMLCGLHSLYLPQSRRCLDLKIYMDTDEKLRRFWKIQRDTVYRGYSREKIIQQIEERIPDAQKYIYPQKKYADMIIRYYDKDLEDYMADNHEVKISIKITMNAVIDIEPLINELALCGLDISYDYLEENIQMQVIDIDAENLEKVDIPVEKIANRIIPQLEEVTREDLDIQEGKEGILTLFFLLMVSKKMEGDI